ncbi:MAG: IPT/TIG domain-containing protein [Acidobacteriota bacterium]
MRNPIRNPILVLLIAVLVNIANIVIVADSSVKWPYNGDEVDYSESPASGGEAAIVPQQQEKPESAAPIITKLSSQSDGLDGGLRVVIKGKNFTRDTKLVLGDSAVTNLTIKNKRTISFLVPAQQIPGARTLTVENAGGVAQREFDIVSKSLSQLSGVEITTVAGGVTYAGDGNSGLDSSVTFSVSSIAMDKEGNLFVADRGNCRVRRIDAKTGIITTVVGKGIRGAYTEGSLALTVGLDPDSLAVDNAGNLFIAEFSGNRVFRVDASSGVISTVAGNGRNEFSGDGNAATQAGLNDIQSLAVDKAGNLFIADQGNRRVRRVDAATGIITTVAGNGSSEFLGDDIPAINTGISPVAVVADTVGNIFITDFEQSRVRRVDAATGIITTVAGNGIRDFSGDGGMATQASLNFPQALTLDEQGNLFIADRGNGRIRQVDITTGIITTIAGNGIGTSDDGMLATLAKLDPISIAIDRAGNLFIGEFFSNRVRRVDGRSRIISTVVRNNRGNIGDDGPATKAKLNIPSNIAFDAAGNLFIADRGSARVRRVDATTGMITTVAGTGMPGFSGDGGPAIKAQLFLPIGIAVDTAGNLFIGDGSVIRRVDAKTAIITTIAGNGNAQPGENGLAINSRLSTPIYLTTDAAGNLFVTSSFTQRVQKIDLSTGMISTVAGSGFVGLDADNVPATQAKLNFPVGVAVDAAMNNLFIADSGNNRIRRVDLRTGIITTVGGDGTDGFRGDGRLAINASFSLPQYVVVDQAGNLLVADTGNHRVRRIDARTGIIITVAGDGVDAFRGDNGLAIKASINFPVGLALDNKGNLFIADTNNNAIRAVKEIAKTISTIDKPEIETEIVQEEE